MLTKRKDNPLSGKSSIFAFRILISWKGLTTWGLFYWMLVFLTIRSGKAQGVLCCRQGFRTEQGTPGTRVCGRHWGCQLGGFIRTRCELNLHNCSEMGMLLCCHKRLFFHCKWKCKFKVSIRAEPLIYEPLFLQLWIHSVSSWAEGPLGAPEPGTECAQ